MNIPREQKWNALRRRWIYEQFKDELVRAQHCHTSRMLADANTKQHSAAQQQVNAQNLQGHGEILTFSTVERHARKF